MYYVDGSYLNIYSYDKWQHFIEKKPQTNKNKLTALYLTQTNNTQNNNNNNKTQKTHTHKKKQKNKKTNPKQGSVHYVDIIYLSSNNDNWQQCAMFTVLSQCLWQLTTLWLTDWQHFGWQRAVYYVHSVISVFMTTDNTLSDRGQCTMFTVLSQCLWQLTTLCLTEGSVLCSQCYLSVYDNWQHFVWQRAVYYVHSVISVFMTTDSSVLCSQCYLCVYDNWQQCTMFTVLSLCLWQPTAVYYVHSVISVFMTSDNTLSDRGQCTMFTVLSQCLWQLTTLWLTEGSVLCSQCYLSVYDNWQQCTMFTVLSQCLWQLTAVYYVHSVISVFMTTDSSVLCSQCYLSVYDNWQHFVWQRAVYYVHSVISVFMTTDNTLSDRGQCTMFTVLSLCLWQLTAVYYVHSVISVFMTTDSSVLCSQCYLSVYDNWQRTVYYVLSVYDNWQQCTMFTVLSQCLWQLTAVYYVHSVISVFMTSDNTLSDGGQFTKSRAVVTELTAVMSDRTLLTELSLCS